MEIWGSFELFFEKLNKLEYLVLRNHETLMKDIFSGGDIDILCMDKEFIVNQIHAFPRISGERTYNYWVMVENKKVPIDIREVGDGYYDKKWEEEMMANRVKRKEYYILDDTNYKYSLLYHALIHKPCIAEKYIDVLGRMFGTKIGEDEKTDKLLCSYMKKQGYLFVNPLDRGVAFNKKNYTRLSDMMMEI